MPVFPVCLFSKNNHSGRFQDLIITILHLSKLSLTASVCVLAWVGRTLVVLIVDDAAQLLYQIIQVRRILPIQTNAEYINVVEVELAQVAVSHGGVRAAMLLEMLSFKLKINEDPGLAVCLGHVMPIQIQFSCVVSFSPPLLLHLQFGNALLVSASLSYVFSFWLF